MRQQQLAAALVLLSVAACARKTETVTVTPEGDTTVVARADTIGVAPPVVTRDTVTVAQKPSWDTTSQSQPTYQPPSQPPTYGQQQGEMSHTISKGTRVEAMINDSINSRSTTVGTIVNATLKSDVRDQTGSVIFPSGSNVKLKVTQLKPAEEEGDAGEFALEVVEVTANGKTWNVSSQVDSMSYQTQGRGWQDKEKIGIGAAGGAILGGVIGGSMKGAVIGGLLGAGAGAVIADRTQKRDVVVTPGTVVSFELEAPVTVRMVS